MEFTFESFTHAVNEQATWNWYLIYGIMSVKQTLYHRASGFRVHRENPGTEFSRRGTMSGEHGIMKKYPREAGREEK